jgi:hypothetical protein
MNLKTKIATVVAGAAIAVGSSGCGPAGVAYANSTYCVNHMTGQVVSPSYCSVGYPLYNPAIYDYWVGNTYGRSYAVGVVIQKNYFSSGRQINPGDSSARKAAGIPVSGTVKTGAGGVKTAPAKPQAPAGGSNKTGSVTTTKPSGGFSTGRSSSSGTRSSGSFSSGRSSSGGHK